MWRHPVTDPQVEERTTITPPNGDIQRLLYQQILIPALRQATAVWEYFVGELSRLSGDTHSDRAGIMIAVPETAVKDFIHYHGMNMLELDLPLDAVIVGIHLQGIGRLPELRRMSEQKVIV